MNMTPPEAAHLPLHVWKPVHSARLRLEADGLIYADAPGMDYHLMRISDPLFANRRLRLVIRMRPAAGCDTEFYVNHWGGIDVCRIAADGGVRGRGISESITVTPAGDGWFDVVVVYYSSHETVSVGTSRGEGGRYDGRGADQYAFARLDVAIHTTSDAIAPGGSLTGYLRSQWGQDQFIYDNLMSHRGGTFFEVGAHEGVALSNSFFFEKALGWTGILVEMQPRYFPEIIHKRQGARCVNGALGTEAMELLYLDAGDRSGLLRYFEHAAVVHLEQHSQGVEPKPDYRVRWVKVRPTMEVFAEAGISHVDYFSLDVEGAEMTILRSLDFDQVSIDMFTIEDNATPWTEHRAFLEPKGYTCIGALGVDAFFLHQRFIDRLAAERGAGYLDTVRAKLRPVSTFTNR